MARLPIESCTPTTVVMDGREFLSFGGCNYLGLGGHPRVTAALAAALADWGISTTASRETTGNTLAHEALESELAGFTGQEAAILSAEGYTANFMAMQALAPEHRVALIDAQAHRSIRHAAVAAGMQVFDYEHLNADSAAFFAKRYADAGVVIITDSVFAADGALAPLDGLLRALPTHRGTLVVDDCHGFCVLGPGGQGAIRHFGLDDPRVVMTTTLAKGLGCYGGAVLGRARFVRSVRERAWVYRSSTPVPPAIAEACRAALEVVQSEPVLLRNLRRNIALMRGTFERLSLPLPPEGVPIFTFWLQQGDRMQRVHDLLRESGILAPLIDYPGGPSPWYFRVVVNAAHSEADLARFDRSLGEALAEATSTRPVLNVG